MLSDNRARTESSTRRQQVTPPDLHSTVGSGSALPGAQRAIPVFLVDHDGEISRELSGLLRGLGYAVQAFNDPDAARNAAPWERPHAIITNVDTRRTPEQRLEIIGDIRTVLDYRPRFIFLTEEDDFDTRVGAARHAADAYFCKPINLHHLSSALSAMLDVDGAQQLRVMLVERKAASAVHWAGMFKRQGVDVRTVSKPRTLLQRLMDFRPELILIESETPDAECFGLIRLVRLDEACFNTPVVVLAGGDAGPHGSVLQAGADDVILKSDCTDELIAGLVARVRRYRRLSNMILYDPLTGAVSREAFLDRATAELSAIRREGGSGCLVMIDIDRFKSINDTYGHIVGDAALRQVSNALKKRLRRSDIVGRYAGDEFIAFLPRTGLENGLKVLESIRQSLVDDPLEVDNIQFSVTLSIGALEIDRDSPPQIETLIAKADALLYEAKRGGRNRIVSQ